MIVTVTCNPSIDYIVTVPEMKMGRTNRTKTQELFPGGKGLNVSAVLKNLGHDSLALGIIAGFTGSEIERMVSERGINCSFLRLSDGMSRINVKIVNEDGTEINGRGPVVGRKEQEALLSQLDELKDGDVLILSGSVSEGMDAMFYRIMMERVQDQRVLCVVDASGDLLRNALVCRPFLIKPNLQELEAFFDVKIEKGDRRAIADCGKRLQDAGARNVLISLGGDGGVLLTEDGLKFDHPAPKGNVVNSVGAGDSMVAGFIAGYLDTGDYAHAFRMGLAAGSASAFSEGLATREAVEMLYDALA